MLFGKCREDQAEYHFQLEILITVIGIAFVIATIRYLVIK